MLGMVTLLSLNVSALELGAQKRFFDYGNGAINLDMVTYITPDVDYIITFASDDQSDFLAKYGSSSTAFKDVGGWLDPANWSAEPYYFYEIGADIKFDQFTLTTVAIQRFVKLPTTREELESISSLEKFNAFLTKLDEHLVDVDLLERQRNYAGELNEGEELITQYGSRYDVVLEKLSPLTEESAKELIESLKQHDETYKRAVN